MEIKTYDVIGKHMDSLQMLELSYKTYSILAGFNVGIDDVKRKKGIIIMQRWVCSKEGFCHD